MIRSVSRIVLTVLLGFSTLLGASNARAAANDILLNFGGVQSQFDAFTEEIGEVLAYNPVSPAEPLGILGFDVGVSVTVADIDNALWDQAVADANAPGNLLIPRLQARKGLPMGIDVGLSYTKVPSSNVTVIGGELRKALIHGNAALPAISVLGHYTQLSGVSQLDLNSYGIDLGISKGILMFTPYAGIGQLWIDATPNGSGADAGLVDANSNTTRGYVGLKFSLMPLVNVVGQANFGSLTSYTLRVNIGM